MSTPEPAWFSPASDTADRRPVSNPSSSEPAPRRYASLYLVSEHLIEGDKTLWHSAIPYVIRLTHRGYGDGAVPLSARKANFALPPMISVVHIAGDNIGSPIQAGSPGAHQSLSIGGSLPGSSPRDRRRTGGQGAVAGALRA